MQPPKPGPRYEYLNEIRIGDQALVILAGFGVCLAVWRSGRMGNQPLRHCVPQ
jgi:hypothetical protein